MKIIHDTRGNGYLPCDLIMAMLYAGGYGYPFGVSVSHILLIVTMK